MNNDFISKRALLEQIKNGKYKPKIFDGMK